MKTNGTSESFNITLDGETEITVFFTRKKGVKNINLYVRSGRVYITAPYRAKKEDAEGFALRKRAWLIKHLKAFFEKERYAPDYSDGGKIRIFGKDYTVAEKYGKKQKITIDQDILLYETPFVNRFGNGNRMKENGNAANDNYCGKGGGERAEVNYYKKENCERADINHYDKERGNAANDNYCGKENGERAEVNYYAKENCGRTDINHYDKERGNAANDNYCGKESGERTEVNCYAKESCGMTDINHYDKESGNAANAANDNYCGKWGGERAAVNYYAKENGERGDIKRYAKENCKTVCDSSDSPENPADTLRFEEKRRIFFEKFLISTLKKELSGRIPLWENRTGLKCSAWSVTRMKSRWGSCSLKTKKIRFSLLLAEKPLECLDYVVVHELTHLLTRYHDKKFYGYLKGFFPEYEKAEKLLK
ncbi:MAG: M48 family metallopeptidase [Clostridiales bacterium]|jgi:predicted metal-dependent hydrolase|nr:M48 family metallopeptidase [Clostridiales bacterium]